MRTPRRRIRVLVTTIREDEAQLLVPQKKMIEKRKVRYRHGNRSQRRQDHHWMSLAHSAIFNCLASACSSSQAAPRPLAFVPLCTRAPLQVHLCSTPTTWDARQEHRIRACGCTVDEEAKRGPNHYRHGMALRSGSGPPRPPCTGKGDHPPPGAEDPGS